MYGVFLFGYLSEQDDILAFMRDEVSHTRRAVQRDLEYGQVDHISKIIRMKLSDELLH